jgi:Uma2 family endonuclease
MTPGYSRSMQAAMIHESFVEERRVLGHDRFDEVWDGVLYMAPQPTPRHNSITGDLYVALRAAAERRGLHALTETAVHPAERAGHHDYRAPDVVVVDERDLSERGVEGRAVLAVEVMSPGDESRRKLPFYARVGVREVWLVDPAARTVEIHVCALDGTTRIVEGASPAVGVELSIRGTQLTITDGTAAHVVELARFGG